MNIPIFPLPIFLLPDGITRLKIFEQRYLNMVKIALKNNGFAIVLNELLTEKKITASWVDIINFNTTEQGVLVVDVKCKSLIILTSPRKDEHDLLWASYKPIEHWSPSEHTPSTTSFSQLLHSYFKQHRDLSALYNNEFIDSPTWVISRWLELLPIPSQEKACFFDNVTYKQAEQFLSELLTSKNLTLM